MTTEIKFECISCQQRILVHGDAAGMHTDCPRCGSSVTVPETGGLNDRHYTAPKRPRDSRRAVGASRESLGMRNPEADLDQPEVSALRQNLIEATVEMTRLERELSSAKAELSEARTEAAKARQQYDATVAETEKLHANARQTQAELKSFQTERLTLKSDLSSLRQKVGAADERMESARLELLDAQARLGEQEAELEQTQRAAEMQRLQFDELRVEQAQLQEQTSWLRHDLNEREHSATTLAAELKNIECEFDAAKDLLNEAQTERTMALREIGTLTEERASFQVKLDEARAQLAVLAQTEAKLGEASRDLAQTREQLAAAEGSVQKMGAQVGELQRTLSEKSEGREFIEARKQLEVGQAEHAAVLQETRELRTSLEQQATAAQLADENVKRMRQQLEEALRAAEAGSQSRLRRDNDVLRGIVARQNGDLEQKHLQLMRLKRAQFALKIVYSIFAIGLAAIGIAAWKFVPALHHF